jgi:hypothetical protein
VTHNRDHIVIQGLTAPLTTNGKWKVWHLLALTNLLNGIGWFF